MITDNDNEGHNYILIIAPLDNYHHLPAVRLNAVIIRLRNVSFLHTFPSTPRLLVIMLPGVLIFSPQVSSKCSGDEHGTFLVRVLSYSALSICMCLCVSGFAGNQI